MCSFSERLRATVLMIHVDGVCNRIFVVCICLKLVELKDCKNHERYKMNVLCISIQFV